jgi:hypothetical protein
MLAATLLGIFFIPSLFVVVERLAGRQKRAEPAKPALSVQVLDTAVVAEE